MSTFTISLLPEFQDDAYWETPYTSPEMFGLEIVHSLDNSDAYSFVLTVVWRHLESGVLLWGMDSGCSCPTPFEGHSSLQELEPRHISRAIMAFPGTRWEKWSPFARKVRKALAAAQKV